MTNGIAMQYNQILKPCCSFNPKWKHTIGNTDLSNWHKSIEIQNLVSLMDNNIWPDECSQCKNHESQGISSMRQKGNNSYNDYDDSDITLEIRPGNICNLACQTCWPEASSRVISFYQQANLLTRKQVVSIPLKNYESLLSIKDRLKNISILGGETFYDKNCLNLLKWLIKNNFTSTITIITNGTNVDFDLLEKYKHKIKLVFSLDAIEKPSEYIRYGSKWDIVKQNYLKSKTISNIETRVNITLSTYNYCYLPSLIDFLIEDWPSVVSFSRATIQDNTNYMDESIIPLEFRDKIISDLNESLKKILKSSIELNQKLHAIHNIKNVVDNLKNYKWDNEGYEKFKEFVKKMDAVKMINFNEYCQSAAVMFDL
jgi:organic radical activating enzyme